MWQDFERTNPLPTIKYFGGGSEYCGQKVSISEVKILNRQSGNHKIRVLRYWAFRRNFAVEN